MAPNLGLELTQVAQSVPYIAPQIFFQATADLVWLIERKINFLEKQFPFGYLISALMPRGTAISVKTLVMASLRVFFCSLVML